jgi:hypothetical protein
MPVIGNPPYIRIQTMKEWAPLEVEIYKGNVSIRKGGQLRYLCGLCRKGVEFIERARAHGLYFAAQVFQFSIWRSLCADL